MDLRSILNPLLEMVSLKGPLRLGLAVSGGSDSMTLLKLAHLWKQLEPETAPFFYAFTVHHHLRPEADTEVQGVFDYCRQWNIPHAVLDWYPTQQDTETSLQENARFARHNLLRQACYEYNLQGLLLAHTQTDQHETIIFRALRNSDTNGFIGISPVVKRSPVYQEGQPLYLFRPLLNYTRTQLRTFLKEQNILWFNDKSNEDPHYTRIAIRKADNLLREKGLINKVTSELANKAQILRLLEQNDIAQWIKKSVKLYPEGWITIEKLPDSTRTTIQGLIVLLKLCKKTDYPVSYESIEKSFHDFIKNRKPLTVGGALWVFYKDEVYLFPEIRQKRSENLNQDIEYPPDLPVKLRRYFHHKSLIHPQTWDFIPFTDFAVQQVLFSFW